METLACYNTRVHSTPSVSCELFCIALRSTDFELKRYDLLRRVFGLGPEA
jgi:hypothetical protein